MARNWYCWALAALCVTAVILSAGCGLSGIDDEGTALPPKQATATAPPSTPAPPSAPPSTPPADIAPAKSGPLVTGASISAGSFTASPEGTSHSVGDEGKALEGMVIKVDPKTHRQPLKYLIAYAPITGCTIPNIRPVSPLISIDNGGGYAERAVDITVPVQLKSGDFPLGFFFRANTGKLEAMPLLKYDSSSVTVASCHFLPFFISAISVKDLDNAIAGGATDSGFRPGRDDWRFPNYGSYISPNGICSGMAHSALWYYLNRPDGPQANLAARMGQDSAGRPWQEDAQGYRLVSAVQKDINWDNRQTEIQQDLSGTDDNLTMRAFAYAMMAAGEPVEVGVFSSKGGGHSMITYRIENNVLYVADPNYPGAAQRLIRYKPAEGKFEPYQSGQNSEEIAKGNSTAYEQIEFTGKTAFIDWDRIAARWKELQAGRAANDLFPAYRLSYMDGAGRELELDGALVLDQPSVRITARLADGAKAQVEVFQDGKKMDLDSDDGVALKAGRNELGLVINGKVQDGWEYIDFARVTITRKE